VQSAESVEFLSKVRTDLRFLLSSRWFVGLVFLSTALRLYFFEFFHSGSPSKYGPDEGTYAALAKYVSKGMPVQEFPTYGPGLYNSSRSFIVPSSLLIRLGVGELDAVRLVSSSYGLLSVVVFALSLITLVEKNSKGARHRFEKDKVLALALLTLFAFLPSSFLWSTLGLRESASSFWLLATFYFALKLFTVTRERKKPYFFGTSLSLVFAFGARRETALVFSVILFIMGVAILWRTQKSSILLAMIVGFIGGQVITTTPDVMASEKLVAFSVDAETAKSPSPVQSFESKSPSPVQSFESKSPSPVQSFESKSPSKPIDSMVSKKCEFDQQVIVTENGEFICKVTREYSVEKFKLLETAKNQIQTVTILEEKRNANRIEAESAFAESACSTLSNQLISTLICNLSELPYRLTAFLIRPFPLLDYGSSSFNFAGLENILWLILLTYTVWTIIRSRVTSFHRWLSFGLLSFVVMFSVAAALYEGNMGTAFRHKSSILWPLLLIIFICRKQTNTTKDIENTRL
jgi:hypothetical protein